jgi:hypothetical protein
MWGWALFDFLWHLEPHCLPFSASALLISPLASTLHKHFSDQCLFSVPDTESWRKFTIDPESMYNKRICFFGRDDDESDSRELFGTVAVVL